MAIDILTVGTSPVALHTAGPNRVNVKNTGSGMVYLGPSGAGNQKFPLSSGQSVNLTIDTSEVVYAVSESGTNRVAVATGNVSSGGAGGTPDDNTVSTAKLVDGAVTYAKLATATKQALRINLRDFISGTFTDNSTNITSALNTALTFAGPGVEVYIPAGNYVVDAFTLGSGQIIQGAGWYFQRDATGVFGHAGYASTTVLDGTVLRSTATSGAAVTHVDSVTHTGGGLRDLALIGPGSGTSVGVRMGQDTPTVKAVISPDYRNVLVANFATGYEMHHVNEAKFYGLSVRGCTKGVSMIHDVNANTWIGLNIQRCTTALVMESDGSCYGNTFVSPIIQNNTGDHWIVRGFDNTWISPYHETPSNPVGPFYLFDFQTGNRNTVINPDVHVTNPLRIRLTSSSHHNTIEMVDAHAARYDIVDDGASNKFTGDFDTTNLISGSGTNRIVEDRRNAYVQFPRYKFTAGPEMRTGTGHPEGSVTAPVGSTYQRSDALSLADAFYFKASGTGNTGWRALGPAAAKDELTSAGELWPDRMHITSGTAQTTSGVVVLSYYTAQKTETINSITLYSGTIAAGATPTLVRAGIYSIAGNGDLTLIASIPNDTTIFASAQTAYQRSLSAPFSKVAGTRYAVGLIVVTAAAMPNYHGIQMAPTGVLNNLVREAPALCGRLTGQTDLPASISDAAIIGFQSMMAIRLNT